MFINVGDKQYELSTKLGTGKKIESRFKVPLVQLFGRLETALSNELTDIIAIAADKASDREFIAEIDDSWDYSDLYGAVQELVLRFQFTGSHEDIERKIAKCPVDETQKNVMRELLGMPLPEIQTEMV